MAVSGTNNFLPDIADIAEEAYERAGLEMKSSYQLRTARRSIDLMLIEWQNRGLNLWCVEEKDLGSLTEGDSTYVLDSNTVAVLDVLLRENHGDVGSQVDYELGRISLSAYSGIPNKLTKGRPLQFYLERGRSDVTLNLWPVPDSSSKYRIIYHRVNRMDDSGPGGSYKADVPDRFVPALVAGLAYSIALKNPESSNRIEFLKQAYDEQFSLAAEEDREKAPVRFYPGGYEF